MDEKDKRSLLGKNFDSLLKIATALLKFGALVGGVCIAIYSLRIGRFPRGLSLTDGALLLWVAACFGGIYLFFTASLVSLGVLLSPVIRFCTYSAIKIANLFGKYVPKQKHEFAPIEFHTVIFALFAVVFIMVMGQKNSTAYWNLPLLSIGLYLFFSVYRSAGLKIKKIEAIKKSLVDTDDKSNIAQIGDAQHLRQVQLAGLAIILIFPLVIGGVSGQILDAAMRTAHIRIEKAVVYVKEPYASLLPKSLLAKVQHAPAGFTQFDDVLVTFNGLGTSTVLSVKDEDKTRKPEIPNDHIIVEDN